MNRFSERSLLLLLATVQFTHIMDFMILMPLGPQLMRNLLIGPGQFSALVAAYTISSGVIGLLAAPFIDRFDRRNVLLLAYGGFIIGTVSCALSQDFVSLLAARAGKLAPLEWRDDVALTVVMASKGYPGSYEKGHVISEIGRAHV